MDTLEWQRKGATLSDKSAKKEFGLTEPDILRGIRSGTLQYQECSTHGSPWFRLLRREVEALARSLYGSRTVEHTQARLELKRVEAELKRAKAQVASLEARRLELLAVTGTR